ncbi:hypothetical protein [Pectobacterium versatile]|uniref:hypothetical protein n=1 Tax=Pectobacterium versatile TaxID=2488639 RepID=UPI001CCBE315|nr:hypothetical protein [Pectobacterium versatile]
MQRQAMGVALHIVLLPFLNYCIAQLIHTMPTVLSAFFLPLDPDLFRHPAGDVAKCLWHFIMVGYHATPFGPSQATL